MEHDFWRKEGDGTQSCELCKLLRINFCNEANASIKTQCIKFYKNQEYFLDKVKYNVALCLSSSLVYYYLWGKESRPYTLYILFHKLKGLFMHMLDHDL